MMITAEQTASLSDLPAPEIARRGRALARPDHAARAEDAALRRRADRHRAGAAARAAVPRHRAGARRIKQQHQVRDRRAARWAAPSYRYRITDAGRDARDAVPRAEPLRRRRAGAARAVPARTWTRSRPPRRTRSTRAACARRSRIWSSASACSTSSGPAINAGHSMFVYGPPGNGKTVISQAIHNLLDGDIAIPHALEVEGSIIRFFDPVNHEPIAEAGERDGLDLGDDVDRRWVRCRRPMVMVGGELTLESLELSYSPTLGFYRAPVQAVANGGVLVIDDFGRQRVLAARPAEPLDRAAREPRRLPHAADRAEVRAAVHDADRLRDQHQAERARRRSVPAPHPLQGLRGEPDARRLHRRSSRTAAASTGSSSDRDVVETLLANYFKPRQISLRGCQPRDLIDQVALARRVSGRAAGADAASCSKRPAPLLRGRPRSAAVRVTVSSTLQLACMMDRVQLRLLGGAWQRIATFLRLVRCDCTGVER